MGDSRRPGRESSFRFRQALFKASLRAVQHPHAFLIYSLRLRVHIFCRRIKLPLCLLVRRVCRLTKLELYPTAGACWGRTASNQIPWGHSSTLTSIAFPEGIVNSRRHIPFQFGNEQVVDSLQRFSSRSVHTLDLVSDVSITVRFSQVRRGAI